MFDLEIPLTLDRASTISTQIDAFIFGLVAVSIVFAVAIFALTVFFAVKYNHTNDADRTNPLIDSKSLEFTWTFIPLVVALSVFVWSANVYFKVYDPPEDSLEIYVIGKQWMWKMQHPDGKREVNDLHIPINQPIKLTMISQDVIHSFYVPAFRVKQDVLPGRYTTMWFEATKTGTYHIFCAEYCGAEHSKMIGRVIVMEPTDYEAWLRQDAAPAAAASSSSSSSSSGGGQASAPAELPGKAIFDANCLVCHAMEGGGVGPSLSGLFGTERPLDSGETVVADEDYLRESILEPGAKVAEGFPNAMSTFQGQFDEEQILDIIDYIKSLGASSDGASADVEVDEAMAAEGEGLYQQYVCESCHIPDGGPVAPSLVGIFGSERTLDSGDTITADEAYLTESMLEPNAKVAEGFTPAMPPVASEDEAAKIVEYLKTIQ